MRIKHRFALIEKHWDRSLRTLLFSFLLIFPLGLCRITAAESVPNPELEGILRKIESRHYRWIAIRAGVLLFFAKAGDSNAMCGGELLYQRLDERMFLTCVDARQELIFIFRTFDRRFDLYLPSQNKVYHGSIFDLEDSPDIESHLKARDLYRALKPMAMDPRRTKVEQTNSAITSLNVYGRNENAGVPERKLYLTPEGDVRGELFYNSKGQPVTEIQRYDFRELRDPAGSYHSVIFPKKITITSPETKKGSAIFFTKVKALDTIDPLDFILRIPPGTQEIFLDEKDPRFRSSKITPPPPATQVPPVKKTVPVYLAKSLRRSVAKIAPPAREEKKTPKTQKLAVSPLSPSSVDTNTSRDTDIATDLRTLTGQPSAADNQTTLDPSVEPSVEMEKQ